VNPSKTLNQGATQAPEKSRYLAPKRRCTVTVTELGWVGAKEVALRAGCQSISELLERLGRGELSLAEVELEAPLPEPKAVGKRPPKRPFSLRPLWRLLGGMPKAVVTLMGAALILFPILYVINLSVPSIAQNSDQVGEIASANLQNPLEVGEQVGGFSITDDFGIRPVHPVTGERNVPHNGVDVATPIGTAVYAVGKAGDQVEVNCWWDVDGGGQVANQTAKSYPGYVFQFLHLKDGSCQSGRFRTGESFAQSGNTGIGSGEHLDFRVKINEKYVPPETMFLESALTGKPLPHGVRKLGWWR
jgi:murein DD-endopeptidase MepM/ murein hydrolase activator NlpD